MKIQNIQKDWWLANSVLFFLFAAIIIISSALSGNIAYGLIGAAFDIILAIALLQKSKIVFWLIFITNIYSALKFLFYARTDMSQLYSVSFLILVVKIAFILMLWQQINNTKEIKHKKGTVKK
jgi:hypothetical protein